MERYVFLEGPGGRFGIGERSRDDAAALAFAEQTAELDLRGQLQNTPAWILLGGADDSPRPIGQVCFSTPEIAEARRDGVATIKIKDLALGAPKIDRDYALRIDLNGRDELTAALALDPELIEEPKDLRAGTLAARANNDRTPIAADESLATPEGAAQAIALAKQGSIHAFVLKPVLLGGYGRCLELAKTGVPSIVTHYFDGPVAHAAATQLAFALPKTRFAHGLGWHCALDRRDVPHLERGSLRAPDWPGVVPPELREAILRRRR